MTTTACNENDLLRLNIFICKETDIANYSLNWQSKILPLRPLSEDVTRFFKKKHVKKIGAEYFRIKYLE